MSSKQLVKNNIDLEKEKTTYENIENIVVDDGTKNMQRNETLAL